MFNTVSIKVYGKVQGVWFRQSTFEKATALGITGWVRNLADDSVHIVASGEPVLLNEFISWCRQGPPKARVENIIVEEMENVQFDHFNILRG